MDLLLYDWTTWRARGRVNRRDSRRDRAPAADVRTTGRSAPAALDVRGRTVSPPSKCRRAIQLVRALTATTPRQGQSLVRRQQPDRCLIAAIRSGSSATPARATSRAASCVLANQAPPCTTIPPLTASSGPSEDLPLHPSATTWTSLSTPRAPAPGRAIIKPVTGTATAPSGHRPTSGGPFLVTEGLLGYYTPALRAMFDVRVYLARRRAAARLEDRARLLGVATDRPGARRARPARADSGLSARSATTPRRRVVPPG